MSFSRLLLIAASSKKYIVGEGDDKVIVRPRVPPSGSDRDPYAGEVVLCFQLDDPKDQAKRVSRGLGIPESAKRCDGLIFHAQDENEYIAICLVEMKSTVITDVAEQIKSTRDHIKKLLLEECSPHCSKELKRIKWKACFYHHSTDPDDVRDIISQLQRSGFDDVEDFAGHNNDVGPFLRGEVSAKAKSNQYRRGKRR